LRLGFGERVDFARIGVGTDAATREQPRDALRDLP
jgi:hypothetical protein